MSNIFPVVLGTCLPTFGAKQGEMCERDGDCESGLICSGSDIKTCIPVTEAKKQYGKDNLSLITRTIPTCATLAAFRLSDSIPLLL